MFQLGSPVDFVAPARACDVTEPGADPRARRSAVAAQSGKCSSGEDLRGQADCALVDVEVGRVVRAASLAACSDSDETSRDALGDVSEVLAYWDDSWIDYGGSRRVRGVAKQRRWLFLATQHGQCRQHAQVVVHPQRRTHRRWRSAPCAPALGRGRSDPASAGSREASPCSRSHSQPSLPRSRRSSGPGFRSVMSHGQRSIAARSRVARRRTRYPEPHWRCRSDRHRPQRPARRNPRRPGTHQREYLLSRTALG